MFLHMRIHRLYQPDLNTSSQRLTLDKSASRYLLQVLRCKPGQQLQLFDGNGTQCEATLDGGDKNSVTVTLHTCSQINHESPLSIRLALGISKGERMDIAIQKAVELGVSEIQPVQTEFSVVNLTAERAEKRRQHWQGIIISACEQCGRNTLPRIHPVVALSDWLKQRRDGESWLFTPDAETSLSSQMKPMHGATLLIGPEGGLSDQEISVACANGFKALKFGPRILRTETAAIACITAIQTLWGDLA